MESMLKVEVSSFYFGCMLTHGWHLLFDEIGLDIRSKYFGSIFFGDDPQLYHMPTYKSHVYKSDSSSS